MLMPPNWEADASVTAARQLSKAREGEIYL